MRWAALAEFVGEQGEFALIEEAPGERSPYERRLTDAMVSDGAVFARADAVGATWALVDAVLAGLPAVIAYVGVLGSAGSDTFHRCRCWLA
jgi:glucose-6-phosphate 1-dehydrogenase